ncbi:hypothetical protein LOTGIDRAFT_157785 [Lottia gigantea]|uniref:mitogen-activated protein kinase kinase n=1 Tax=Lottia gigantea TaxID=225164 RepID=V4B2E8_LOTGI|nr:hypothetical protein LOTGIDRAFT_157785 [Lottia gigantea]ESP00512.1 hypothetical protein LOTGIDRAFT_157785 [Lottia gigantea]
MNEPPFTLRIHVEGQQDMDWMVQPEDVTFQRTLEVISQLLPHSTITAFEYEDEDNDRVTVRGDDEMRNMFADYFTELSEEDRARGMFPPLIIYPKLGKSSQVRNLLGLKIKTSKSDSGNEQEMSTAPPDSKLDSSSDSNKSIHQILACGSMKEEDLQYVQVLGSGNGGQVYKTIHKSTKSLMALKVIQLDLTPLVQKQILSEMEILHKCNSVSIIAFYGAFFNENKISICTEYMDGGSLDRYIPVPENVLGAMSAHIINGLVYMWNLKILHRDIKPSNILVNSTGQVKLCDFGVSTQLVKSIATSFVGTNVYMAPERIQGEEYNILAEVWSLGVTLFEISTGKLPFSSLTANMTPFELMDCIIMQNPQSLPSDKFSPDFVHFVNLCLQKNLRQRISVDRLLTHPFVKRNEDGNSQLVAEYVKQTLSQRAVKS